MKIVVSYISSLYDYKKTITLIDESKADAIHADLMDGIYVKNKNFDIESLIDYFNGITKPIEFHLMVDNPSLYVSWLYKLNPICIYIHPSTTKNVIDIISDISKRGIDVGIVINPDEEISKYKDYFLYVNRVLLMSVVPGEGGQEFIMSTTSKLNELLEYKNQFGFSIYVDGGINDTTINNVCNADGVVSGSFICKELNYDLQIDKLKRKIHN